MNMDYMITEGSKYRVNHGDEELTEGVFKGFSVMGNDTAMVFALDDGTLRFINSSQIIFLDLLESVSVESAPKKSEPGSVYYG